MTLPSDQAKARGIALTWSDERIIEYIREGTLDAEIAVRLGLSVGEVKDRIARIAAKLGLNGRSELAAGVPKAELPDPAGSDPAPSEAAEAKTVSHVRAVPAPARIAVLVALIAFGAALVWLALQRKDGIEPPPSPGTVEVSADTATPAARTPAPTFTPTPVMVGGKVAMPLRLADETELPAGTALIIETGCDGCDGPPDSLQRIYRQQDGTYRVNELFRGKWRRTADGALVDYIHGYAISIDGSEIVVGVCTKPGCSYYEGAQPSAEVTLYRSSDGGITWREHGRLPGSDQVAGIVRDELLISRMTWENEKPALSYRMFPLDRPIESRIKGLFSSPRTGPGGQILWQAEGTLVRQDGSPAVDFPLVAGSPVQATWVDASRYAVVWTGVRTYLALIRNGELLSVHTLPSPYVGVAAAIDPVVLVGNAIVPLAGGGEAARPVLISLNEGTIRPLKLPGLGQEPFVGRNRGVGVVRGPVLRVTTPGDCLNVRAEASTASRILDCAADGVLLMDLGTRSGEGEVWARVRTPSGQEGWARGWKPGEVYLVP